MITATVSEPVLGQTGAIVYLKAGDQGLNRFICLALAPAHQEFRSMPVGLVNFVRTEVISWMKKEYPLYKKN